MTTGSTKASVPVPRGLGSVYVHARGPYSTAKITVERGGGTVCTQDLSAGYALPLSAGGAQ